jgi:putative heme-binding domain-containing protein
VPAGDPARGEEVYRRKDMACQKCHAVGGVGGLVGPDLVSIGASAPVDYLVESLVAPSAKIKENYHSVLIATDEGRVVTGIVVRQSPAELVLRDAEDHEVVIPVAQIAQKRDGRSLMPDGSVDALTRGELVDLVRFLSELGKSGPYALSKERLARRWQVLAWSSEAHRRLNRTSYVTAARDDPAFTWEPAYTRVAGELPLAGLPTFVVHAGNAPVTFLRTAIDATSGGPVRLKLNSAAGLSMWLDGEPLEARAESVLDLAPGAHTLTLAVDRDARSDALRLELLDVAGSPTQAQFVGGK